MKDSSRSDISALITTGLSLATNYVAGVSADIESFLAASSPVIYQRVYRVLGLFDKKSFAKIECARLGICYSQMAATVKSYLDKGHKISLPELTQSGEEYSKADEIIEAIFKAAIDDSQTVKSIMYGHLMGNIPFQSKYDASASYLLLKTAMQLTYDELCLLAVIDSLPGKSYFGIEQKAWQGDTKASELFSYVVHINNLGLLKRLPAYYSGRMLDNHQISTFGQDFCDLLELKWLTMNDTKNMKMILSPYLGEVDNPLKKY